MQEPSEEQSVELRQYLQKILVGYETFLSHDAHSHYVKMREIEVLGKQDDIVKMDPVDRATEIEGFKMRGDLRTTQEFQILFEETTTSLKDRIQQLLEKEQPKP